jgi:hypothetical protein
MALGQVEVSLTYAQSRWMTSSGRGVISVIFILSHVNDQYCGEWSEWHVCRSLVIYSDPYSSFVSSEVGVWCLLAVAVAAALVVPRPVEASAASASPRLRRRPTARGHIKNGDRVDRVVYGWPGHRGHLEATLPGRSGNPLAQPLLRVTTAGSGCLRGPLR